jgi:Raf kinase inhibitor-like YbhB/YbcL family protein
MRTTVTALFLVLAVAGCGTGDGIEVEAEDAETITVSSPTISEGRKIPVEFTCDGADVPPDLSWDEVPAETAEIVIVVDDPDAPGGTFTHWTVWGVDPAGRLVGDDPPSDAAQGSNDFGGVGYQGPCPPEGDDPHRYRFRVVALDSHLDLPEGAGPDEVSEAMEGRVVGAGELTASYSR